MTGLQSLSAPKNLCTQKASPEKNTNSLINFKKTQILSLLIAPALVIIAVLTAVPARATPSCGVTTVILATEHFPSGSLDLLCNEMQQYGWGIKTKVKGDSDVYIVQHTFPPGADTGWHTHPSPSMVRVTAGQLAVNVADDPTCTSHVYSASERFTALGCGGVPL